MADQDQPQDPQETLIAPDDPNYPLYKVTYEGNVVPDAPRVTTGPHTFSMEPGASVQITVVQERLPASPGIPNLRITIDKV